jgi:hypothetical protein
MPADKRVEPMERRCVENADQRRHPIQNKEPTAFFTTSLEDLVNLSIRLGWDTFLDNLRNSY